MNKFRLKKEDCKNCDLSTEDINLLLELYIQLPQKEGASLISRFVASCL